MTLIEVLAGLLVLGTLLAAVTIARGRFLTQWADADRRLLVTRAADNLLAHWLADSSHNVPLAGQGSLDGAPGYDWRTIILRDPVSATLGAMTVRLEVFDHRPFYSGDSRSSLTSDAPVLAVDFLVHKPPKIQAAPVPASGANGLRGMR